MSILWSDVSCIVLDVDDTLYLERDYVKSGFAAVARFLEKEWGVLGFFDLAWDRFLQGVRGRVFDEVMIKLGIPDRHERVQQCIAVYRQHTPDIELLPDAAAFLNENVGKTAIGIITDGPAISQRKKVEALALFGRIPTVIITEELGPGKSKPHPEAYLRVEKASGFSGEQCVYIADNPQKDFSGPKALGWRTVRVRRRGGLHYDLPSDAHVDLDVSDLAGITFGR